MDVWIEVYGWFAPKVSLVFTYAVIVKKIAYSFDLIFG